MFSHQKELGEGGPKRMKHVARGCIFSGAAAHGGFCADPARLNAVRGRGRVRGRQDGRRGVGRRGVQTLNAARQGGARQARARPAAQGKHLDEAQRGAAKRESFATVSNKRQAPPTLDAMREAKQIRTRKSCFNNSPVHTAGNKQHMTQQTSKWDLAPLFFASHRALLPGVDEVITCQ